MNAIAKHDERPVQIMDPMVSMIERVVMNPDADLDKLERMLAMKERLDAQNARVSFAAALADARSEIPPIMKDATVDFTSSKGRTHYKHETLAGIAKVIDPILSRYGLSYRFRTEQGQGGVRVTCIIAHSSGHSEETSLACAPDGSGNKNPFQAVGSAVTYLQRYTLKAALGLSAEVDDDAQSAAQRPDSQSRRDQSSGGKSAEKQNEAAPSQKDQSQRDVMIRSIRDFGERAWTDPTFVRDLETLRKASAELAAQVEAEIETQKRNAAIGEDEIPY